VPGFTGSGFPVLNEGLEKSNGHHYFAGSWTGTKRPGMAAWSKLFVICHRIGDIDMKIRPLYDRIIVKRVEQQRKTAAGIVIPDSAAEKPEQGDVVAVGSGRLLRDGALQPLQVKPGERVLFGKYAGQTVKIDDQEFLVMREDEVMGVIEKGTADPLKKVA
jgi:chaperonin GroES